MPSARCRSFQGFPELPKSLVPTPAGNKCPASSVSPETVNIPVISTPVLVQASLVEPSNWRLPPPACVTVN